MIAIDNINGNGGGVDLSNIYNNLKNLNSSVSNLESLTSYGNDISNLKSSVNDLSNSLSTLNGVYTANSFNNQAFNTTLNLNSDMFITGQFGLNSGSIDCSGGFWDLRELKPVSLSSITASNLSNLKMENLNLSSCNFNCSNKCYFDDCSLLKCGVDCDKCVLENCFVSGGNLDNRKFEFKFDSFFDTINFWNGGVLSFCNVDFSTSNFKFKMNSGNNSTTYRIYIMNCLINGTTANGTVFENMFSKEAGVNLQFAMF